VKVGNFENPAKSAVGSRATARGPEAPGSSCILAN